VEGTGRGERITKAGAFLGAPDLLVVELAAELFWSETPDMFRVDLEHDPDGLFAVRVLRHGMKEVGHPDHLTRVFLAVEDENVGAWKVGNRRTIYLHTLLLLLHAKKLVLEYEVSI
jgi:hypothetical protein